MVLPLMFPAPESGYEVPTLAVPIWSRSLDRPCRRLLRSLGQRLPWRGTWITWRSGATGDRQVLQELHPEADRGVWNDLRQENWLRADLPRGRLVRLRRGLGHQGVYVLLWGDRLEDYWLFWSGDPLTLGQRRWLALQGQWLGQWLDLWRRWEQDHQQLHLLQQVLHQGEHQMRHSLGLIKLYGEMLQRGLPPGTWQEQAQVIYETAEHLQGNLGMWLHLGRPLRWQYTSLRSLLQATLQPLLAPLQTQQLRVTYPAGDLAWWLDPSQMRQVWENLLLNAIAFSPVGGEIVCDWQREGESLCLTVGDRGPGIAPEDRPHLFQPYFSRRSGGMGLGLTIVQQVILAHGGTLRLDSPPEGGTLAVIHLPPRPTEGEEG